MLRHLGGEHADEPASLLRRVGDARLVLVPADRAHRIVRDCELDVRVLMRVRLHRVAEKVARRDDELSAVVHRLGVVRLIVAFSMRDVRKRGSVDGFRRRLQTLELVLVEPVVVEAGDVAHERRLVALLCGGRRLGAAERRADGQRRNERNRACGQ